MKVLFSPVGGTDPISLNNCRDGALLHICRVYQPDRVLLYLSKEIMENESLDHRYSYCLERLAELQGRKMDLVMIERPELVNVYEFDYFYEDFRRIIERLYREDLSGDDQLLFNISSGTPAMKSGLTVLQTLGEYPAKLIQVTTPARKMNEHTHRGYDVETLWELDEDNLDDFENRCIEVVCPTLSQIKKEELVKRHLRSYDYSAALTVAHSMPERQTASWMRLLEQAYARYMLDIAAVDRISGDTHYDCTPVKSGNERKYFEYALALEIKLKRQEYGDYIRAITPLIVDMFELILKAQCGIELKDLTYTRGKGERCWDPDKMEGTRELAVLEKSYRKTGFRYGTVFSDALKELIVNFSGNTVLNTLVEDIRHVESRIRNLAAHQIVSISDAKIKAETGFTGLEIWKRIRRLFGYAQFRIPEEAWDSYDRMNAYIIGVMENRVAF